MLDAFALLGYVLLFWSLIEKKVWVFLYEEIFLLDRLVLLRNVTGMYVLFLFIVYWLDNIWQSVGLLLFIILVPIYLFYNVEEKKQNS